MMSTGKRAASVVIVRLFIVAIALLFLFLFLSRVGIIEIPRRYDPFAVPDLNERPGPFISTQLKLIDFDGLNCSAALGRTGIPARLLPDQVRGPKCELTDTLKMSRLSSAKLRTEQMRCNIGARLYMWEKHVVQPAAQRLLGQQITEILHFGSFSCRKIAGRQNMSQHATANAFDISGFKLKDGRVVSILKQWPTQTNDARFLREIREGACDYFNLVLSPEYNKAHADHFHFDMGYWRSCR